MGVGRGEERGGGMGGWRREGGGDIHLTLLPHLTDPPHPIHLPAPPEPPHHHPHPIHHPAPPPPYPLPLPHLLPDTRPQLHPIPQGSQNETPDLTNDPTETKMATPTPLPALAKTIS